MLKNKVDILPFSAHLIFAVITVTCLIRIFCHQIFVTCKIQCAVYRIKTSQYHRRKILSHPQIIGIVYEIMGVICISLFNELAFMNDKHIIYTN